MGGQFSQLQLVRWAKLKVRLVDCCVIRSLTLYLSGFSSATVRVKVYFGGKHIYFSGMDDEPSPGGALSGSSSCSIFIKVPMLF